MTTTPESLPKQPHFYLSLDQVRESGLLSPERMAAVEAEIERRISIPRDEQGRPIETARLADLSPWPRYLYPRMDHDPNWLYIRREIMAVVLTEQEREFLDKHALSAASARRNEAAFEKARKVLASEWDGWVTDGDNYWESVEAYMDANADRLLDDGEPYTHKHLWAAKPRQVIVGRDVTDVFESQMCDRGWDDMDVDDLNGVAELQKALDAFVEANRSVISYSVDYGVAVMLDAETMDRAKRMREADEECNRTGIHPIYQR